MKYLVTGGAGFIGSNLVEELLKQNHNVVVVDDLSSGFISNLIKHQNLVFIKSRIQDLNDVNHYQFDGIFHLAAQASVPLSIYDFYNSSSNNLASSLKVFEIAHFQKIPVIFASSSAIYGNLPFGDEEKPDYEILSPYAQDKLTLEDYSKLFFDIYKISSIGLRFFNVYGPKQDPSNPYSGVISIFIDKFIEKSLLTINGGYQTRDFVYIDDIVFSLIKAMNLAKSKLINDFINIGTGISVSVNELYNQLAMIFNYNVEINYKPLTLGDPERSGGNFNKITNILEIDIKKFIRLESGLQKTVEYFLNQQ
jgi:UDP-glucose 4-epimerase